MLCRSGVLGLKDVLEDTIWSPSPWTQVLENVLSSAWGQHYFMTCWKRAKVMSNVVLSWNTPENLQKKKFWRLNFVEKLRICGRRPFFEIACVSQKFWAKTVYFVSWRTLLHCVFGPKPRAFPSLASDFFGVLGLEPCVLDSTFDVKLVINLANLQTC